MYPIGLGFLVFILGVVAFVLLMLYRESLLKASKRTITQTGIFSTGGYG